MTKDTDITKILDLLDRDNCLELDNEEKTYREDDLVNEINLKDILKEGDESWEISDNLAGEIMESAGGNPHNELRWPPDVANHPIWDFCAWYQPIHFFGHGWGIFVREDCVINQAKIIASFIPKSEIYGLSSHQFSKMMLKASFACFFLHEHFHHKTESFGIRMHVASGIPKYLDYKKNVYRKTLLTDDCLEEAMANADIFQRIVDDPYSQSFKKLMPYIKDYLSHSFQFDPPGYRKASEYLSKANFDLGLQNLQGQINEASLTPTKPTWEWGIATHLTRSLFSIQSNIYSVVKAGSRSILPSSNILPKPCSTNEMIKILQTRGFNIVKGGGKGSHVKLKDSKGKTMILPGNRRELSIGVLNGTLKTIGLSINDLNNLI